MRIGLLFPTIFAPDKLFSEKIFAPRDLLRNLADGLVELNHQVTVFTAEGFNAKAKIVEISLDKVHKKPNYYKLRNIEKERRKLLEGEYAKKSFELEVISTAYRFGLEKELDILHCYHDSSLFFTHYFEETTGFPTIYSLHDPLPLPGSFEYLELDKFKRHRYIALSSQMRVSSLKLDFVRVIHHGLKTANFPFTDRDYTDNLLFIGRLVPEKGVMEAIEIAEKLNKKLIIASTIDSSNRKYFEREIEPRLQKGKIEFCGFLQFEERNRVLKQARCLLFPISWEEPFGMVLIEAMVCGTPIVAYNRGSVPEIVKDGVTGYIINPNPKSQTISKFKIQKTGIEGLIEAVERIYALPVGEYREMRQACRAIVERYFTIEKMVENYERVYRSLV